MNSVKEIVLTPFPKEEPVEVYLIRWALAGGFSCSFEEISIIESIDCDTSLFGIWKEKGRVRLELLGGSCHSCFEDFLKDISSITLKAYSRELNLKVEQPAQNSSEVARIALSFSSFLEFAYSSIETEKSEKEIPNDSVQKFFKDILGCEFVGCEGDFRCPAASFEKNGLVKYKNDRKAKQRQPWFMNKWNFFGRTR